MKHLFLLTLLVAYIPALAHADFNCSAEVSYKWIAADKGEAAPVKDDKKKEGGQAPETKSVDGEKEVFWGKFEVKAATEEEAKAKIKDMLSKERSSAMLGCQDAHENQTKCISAKYAQNNAALNMMSFGQRKEFEKKIIEDCEQANGRCVSASATEPGCKEIVAAESTQGGAAADAKGKDAKGKDAKKK